jgi:hypothetical protein
MLLFLVVCGVCCRLGSVATCVCTHELQPPKLCPAFTLGEHYALHAPLSWRACVTFFVQLVSAALRHACALWRTRRGPRPPFWCTAAAVTVCA